MKKRKNTDQQVKKEQPVLVVNDMTFVSPDRNRKDVGKLKAAIERAESITTPNRARLYDLYHDIVTIDAHLSGVLQKRTDSVLNKKLAYYNADGQKVDAMDTLIGSERFIALERLIMESKYWGVSAVQFIAGSKFEFVTIDRRHIRPEYGEVTKSQYDTHGTPIEDFPLLWMIGESKDLGILLQCSMYALYKRSGFGDFAQYVEIFGQPVRVIHYDAYDSRTKEEIKKILNDSGSSLAMMIPKQADFQMMDGKTSNGNGDLQMALIRACNEEISIAVLGNSETTSSSESSGYAQASVHSQQQMEITKSDIRFVENCLNSETFFGILRSFALPVVEGGYFAFQADTDLAQLKARLDIDMQVAGRVPVSDDYWYETYGIPKPDNYEQMKREQDERRKAMAEALRRSGEDKTDGKTEDGKKTEDKKSKLIDSLADFFGVAPE